VFFAGSFDGIITISYFRLVSYAVLHGAIHTLNLHILVRHTIINASFTVIYIMTSFLFGERAPRGPGLPHSWCF
jgi:hypothetical protein